MLIQGVQRIRETLDGVVELNGSEVEREGGMMDAVMADGGYDIASRFFRPSAMAICSWAARLHMGSTFA